jgi:hypothetical protein
LTARRRPKTFDWRALLDAASGVFGHTFLDADMIDGADLIEKQSAEAGGRFEAAGMAAK